MRTTRRLVPVVVAVWLAIAVHPAMARAAQPTIHYPDFSATTGLTLNGEARAQDAALRLVPTTAMLRGSAYASAPIDTGAALHADFSLRMHDGWSPPGLAFVLQASPAGLTALGEIGDGIGYKGVAPSVAVEFDKYANSTEDAPGGNHVGILANGDVDHHLAFADSAFDLFGSTVFVWVDYDPGATRLAVSVSNERSKPSSPTLTATIDLHAVLGATAWAGFSAANGATYAVADILSWYLGPAPRATTSTSLAASENPSVAGRPVDFTATVQNIEQPAVVPTGSVTFAVDGTPIGAPVALDGTGRATLRAAALGVGPHEVRAAYTPAATTFRPSEATLAHVVLRQPTTTTVLVEPDPTVAGQDATFTATVAASAPGSGVPTGTVQFVEADGTPLDAPQPLLGGRASLTVWAFAGHYNVRARYSGDATFAPSDGSVGQTVNRAGTTTTITSRPNPVRGGEKLTIDIYVQTTPPGDVQPAGTVAILVDGIDISGAIPLFDVGRGVAGVEVTVIAPSVEGSATVGARYSGDANTLPSVAPTFVQVVSRAAGLPAPGTPPVISTTPPPPATTASALRAMTRTLTSALRRRGLAALERTRETLTARAAGTLTQTVHATPRGRKPQLIARASRRYTAAGRAAIVLRMTPAGRRLARRGEALKLEIVTRFDPVTGPPVTASSRLTVKARG